MKDAKRVSVVLADDHEIVRGAVADLLERMGSSHNLHFDLVGQAENGLEALALTKAEKPDLLFLDVSMPFASGAEILHDLKRWSPDTKIIVFTGLTGAGLLSGLIAQGIDGLFSKGGSLDAIREALPKIMEGVPVVDEALVAVIEKGTHGPALTGREQQVLTMIVAGKSNKEVAAELFLSPKTVEKYRTSLMSKLEVHSVAQLMAKAIKEGLVTSD